MGTTYLFTGGALPLRVVLLVFLLHLYLVNYAHLSHGLKDIFLRCHVLLDKFPGRLVLLEFNIEYFRHLLALMDDQFLGDVVLHHLLSELLCQHPPLILHLINLAQEPPDLKKNTILFLSNWIAQQSVFTSFQRPK